MQKVKLPKHLHNFVKEVLKADPLADFDPAMVNSIQFMKASYNYKNLLEMGSKHAKCRRRVNAEAASARYNGVSKILKLLSKATGGRVNASNEAVLALMETKRL